MIIKINESISIDVEFLENGNVVYNRCIIENVSSTHKLKVQIEKVFKNDKLIELFIKDNFNLNIVVELNNPINIKILKVTEILKDGNATIFKR